MSIRQLETAAAWTGDEVRVAANVATHAERALQELGDTAGAAAARSAREALAAPVVSLVIAGEFQQGKSSLINALLGARVCPTEPLSTTATPIRIRWGAETAWFVHLAPTGGTAKRERREIRGDQFDALATAARPAVDGRLVTALEMTLDHPLLRAGVTLTDTPAISGGLSNVAAGVVLGLLPQAAALVFVSDASQELTAPELEFLRIAQTLCPGVLAVLTKTDLFPEWRRILDINQERLNSVATESTVLPVSAQLRAASVRWGDPEMDRESGVPLMSWYLGSTMLTKARQTAVQRCGQALSSSLTGAIKAAERRLVTLDKSGGARAEMYQRAADQLEKLRSEGPRRVRLELRSFLRDTSADLANRFAAVNDVLADFIKSSDPADEWGEIEATLHQATNRALAEHIASVTVRADAMVNKLAESFGLDAGRVSVTVDNLAAPPSLAPDVEDPDFTSEKASRVHDTVRGALSTGLMGAGLATSLLTGGLAAVVFGAGASLSTAFLAFRRERNRDLEARRAKALQTCRTWVTEAHSAVSGYASELHKELEFQLEGQIERALRALLAEGEAERRRLEELSRMAAEKLPEEMRRAREQLDRLRLVEAHARRLGYRVARPELAVVTR